MGDRPGVPPLAAWKKPKFWLGQTIMCALDEHSPTFREKETEFLYICENGTLLVSHDNKTLDTSM